MKNVTEIINSLKSREKEFLNTTSYSKLPGIYAFFYIGDNFPHFGKNVKKHQVVYIGKTESSQEKRDAQTHFVSGKTGSSTVRKSIGAILSTIQPLKPVPRNNKDYRMARYSHFKFDDKGEEFITNWMKTNFALSFYEFPAGKKEIEDLETEIIQELVPILNISKNPHNPFRDELLKLRKKCADLGLKDFLSIHRNLHLKNKANKFVQNKTKMVKSGKYVDLWTRHRQEIKEKLLLSSVEQSIKLDSDDFETVGNRKSYSFNLELNKGIVINNIGGSAVARDLAKVLESSSEIRTILKSGHYKINMDRNFCLWIKKL